MTELTKIVKELNDLIIPINIQIVNVKQDANVLVLFGSKQDFLKLITKVKKSQMEKCMLILKVQLH